MASVDPIPSGYPRVVPYLWVSGAAQALDFYGDVLGATERMRMPGPGGTVGHAEIEIGGSVIMVADESPEMGSRGPKSVGGTPVMLHVYVSDADATFARALVRGATELQPVKDQFYGDRSGVFEDPFGHVWNVATHVEDVPPDEMARRAAQAMGGPPPS